MPTYEYRCQSCADQFEIIQSFSDASLKVCGRCAGELRKVYGNVGISFKGSGFYKNDARSGTSSGSTSAGSSGSEGSSSDSGASSSSESTTTKPAADSSNGSTGTSHAATPSTPAPSTP